MNAKQFLLIFASVLMSPMSGLTHAEETQRLFAPTLDDVRMVAPALARYTQGVLFGDLWKRPDLSARDRSIITVAALIAPNQPAAVWPHFNQALGYAVKPSAIS